MSKGSIKFFYIVLGIGIGFIISGSFFMLNPKVEYEYIDLSDEQILERAAEIRLEQVKSKESEDNTQKKSLNDTLEDEQSNMFDNNTSNKDSITQDNQNNIESEVDDDKSNTSEEIAEKDETQKIEEVEEIKSEVETEEVGQSEESQEAEEIQNKIEMIEEDEELITVTIVWGDSSEVIAKKLFDKGIISNKSEFHNFIEENKAERKLRPGNYSFRKGTDYYIILDQLLK